MIQNHVGLPNIAKATLEMAYDNGAVNREQTEEQILNNLDQIIGSEGYDFANLFQIDQWIGTLSKDDLNTLVAGEMSEMDAVVARSPLPEETNGLLNDIFNNGL